jgi:hypothetical protein
MESTFAIDLCDLKGMTRDAPGIHRKIALPAFLACGASGPKSFTG